MVHSGPRRDDQRQSQTHRRAWGGMSNDETSHEGPGHCAHPLLAVGHTACQLLLSLAKDRR
jgi:hypothetical protein